MSLFRYTRKTFARELALICFAIVFFVPIYLLITLSTKTTSDIYLKPLSLPTYVHGANFSQALQSNQSVTLAHALLNSTIITVGSVIGLIAIGSLCAYTLARRPGAMSTTLYIMFLLGIIIPFQIGIVPLFVAMRHLHLIPSYQGMILLNIGLLMPLTVFLYTGFVRALPRDYEEAAQIDGAGRLSTFVHVVFPLLRPVTGTVAVLTALITWNEFFVPLIFLSGSKYQTVPVAIYSFVSEYTTQWNLVFASVTIALLPIIIFFIVAQRQLMRGFSGGLRG
jgi:raffinose/stachyose/melibiose transport system permease protein